MIKHTYLGYKVTGLNGENMGAYSTYAEATARLTKYLDWYNNPERK